MAEKKLEVFLIIGFLILAISFVRAGWNDFSDNASPTNENTYNNSPTTTQQNSVPDNSVSDGPTMKLTKDFYLAIAGIIAGVLIVLFIIISLFKRPKNSWEKSEHRKS